MYGASNIGAAELEHVILSQPVGIRWAGWETDTLKLQQAGWRIAVQDIAARREVRLALRHDRMDLTAMTRVGDSVRLYKYIRYGYHIEAPLFEVVHIARNIEIERVSDIGLMDHDWRQIDATPLPSTMNKEFHPLDVRNIFRMAVGEVEEVVIEKADMQVIDHLQAIKELQSEKQKELREKARAQRESETAEPVSGEVVVQLTNYR